MTDREIFRKNLSNMLHNTKTKQIDLAKYAEVSFQTVSAWITGRGYPRAETMEKVCKFFGVKQSALTEEQNHETQEDKLIELYRILPEEGKDKLLQRAEELIMLYPRRKKRNGKT